MLASDKQKSYLVSLMRKKCWWEHQPKDITDAQLISEIERRWRVAWASLESDYASLIIDRIKSALDPTYKRARK